MRRLSNLGVTVNEFHVSFDGLELDDAGKAAASLREALLDIGRTDIETRIEKNSAETMDLGTQLALVFGAPAAVAVARGIAQWLAHEGERAGKLVIKTKNGIVVRSVGQHRHCRLHHPPKL